MSSLLRQFTLTLLLLCLSAAASSAQDWYVNRSTKQVQYTVDKQTWQPVELGMTLPNKAWISTGARGRAVLTRGSESITIQPGTLASIISTSGVFTRKTEVVQQKGTLALSIEKRGRPHTYVHTPFLAAVVKGTTFEVTVTAKDASVSVNAGLVEVTSFTGGQQTNLGPGQSATVTDTQQMSVAGVAEPPSVVFVAATAASVPAVGKETPLGAGAFGGAGASSSEGSPSNNSSADSSSASSGGNSSEHSNAGNGGEHSNAAATSGENGRGAPMGGEPGNAGAAGNGHAYGIGNGHAYGVGNGSAGNLPIR